MTIHLQKTSSKKYKLKYNVVNLLKKSNQIIDNN